MQKQQHVERVAGIEPAPSAWKAEVLPLNYTRRTLTQLTKTSQHLQAARPGAIKRSSTLVVLPSEKHIAQQLPCGWPIGAGGWIRTTEAHASDLQSDPFGRSGTPAKTGGILCLAFAHVNLFFSINSLSYTIFFSLNGAGERN